MNKETLNKWRLILGKAMFITPFPIFFLTPIVVPFLGLSAAQTAALIAGILAGVEIVWFASIPLLGKEGFLELKKSTFDKVGYFIKSPGPIRYYIGLGIILISLLADLTAGLIANIEQYQLLGAELLSKVGLDGASQNWLVQIEDYCFAGFLLGAVLVGWDFFVRIAEALPYQQNK